jgi:hypothetical protein
MSDAHDDCPPTGMGHSDASKVSGCSNASSSQCTHNRPDAPESDSRPAATTTIDQGVARVRIEVVCQNQPTPAGAHSGAHGYAICREAMRATEIAAAGQVACSRVSAKVSEPGAQDPAYRPTYLPRAEASHPTMVRAETGTMLNTC